jgi:hypothetical protein
MTRRQIMMSGGGAQAIFSVLDEDSNNEMPDDGWNNTQLAKAMNMNDVSRHLTLLDAYHRSMSSL